MIEREFIKQRKKELQIEDCILDNLKGIGYSHSKLQRTPLGDKIIVFASRPGLLVGKKGANIKNITNMLKNKFNLENPQIEIAEVTAPDLDARIVAERIASSLERFGSARFKGIGYKVLVDVMKAGAMGIEIIMSGKLPSSRARSWRFYQGYLKKCGDISLTGVARAQARAQLKTGTIGIKVRIMPPTTVLPDRIALRDEPLPVVEELKVQNKDQKKQLPKKEAKPKSKKTENRSDSKKPANKQSKEDKSKPAVQEKVE